MMREAIGAGKDAIQLTVNIVTSLYKVMDFLTELSIALCYYLVIPEMAEVKINYPPTVLNKPYTGTCDAAGDPRPIVNTSLNTEHCPHSIFITNTTVYTTQAALRIPSVTDEQYSLYSTIFNFSLYKITNHMTSLFFFLLISQSIPLYE